MLTSSRPSSPEAQDFVVRVTVITAAILVIGAGITIAFMEILGRSVPTQFYTFMAAALGILPSLLIGKTALNATNGLSHKVETAVAQVGQTHDLISDQAGAGADQNQQLKANQEEIKKKLAELEGRLIARTPQEAQRLHDGLSPQQISDMVVGQDNPPPYEETTK